MKAYIICFIFAILFIYLSEKKFNQNKKVSGTLFFILSLFVVCTIAGARDLSVGTDIWYYFYDVFYRFSIKGQSLFFVMSSTSIELGFLLLVYVSSIFKNVHFSLFFVELAVALPIYLFAYKQKNKYSMCYTIAIFMLTMYCRSLNLMRQSIAIALIIYSIPFFEEKKYKKTTIIFIIACLFHFSAIASILIYIFSILSRKKIKYKYMYYFVLFTTLIAISFGLDKILMLFPNKYSRYLGASYQISSLSATSLIKKAFWIIWCLLYIFRYKKKSDEKYYNILSYCTFFIIDFILYFMSVKISSAGRIGYYFLNAAYLLFLPNLKDLFKEKIIPVVGVFAVLILFWYNMTVVNYKADQTYPYTSPIFKFLN